jgi:hypothetical protein
MRVLRPSSRDRVMMALQQFTRLDLRWSYLAIGVLVVVGAVLNVVLPHGWTVWPIIMAVGGMMMVHEAAERNGQGVPPGHAYAFIFGALFTWLFVGILLSAVNVFVLVLGLVGVFVYATQGYIEGRKREYLRAERRREGLCIHCGMRFNPGLEMCDHCGEEPDPLTTQLSRVAGVARNRRNVDRMRAVIKQESITATAARKEQALLARRAHRVARRPGR